MLTDRQRDAIDYYRIYSGPAEWVVGRADPDGRVRITAVTRQGTWSYVLDADGTCRAVPGGYLAPAH
ncbi:MAG: hypothetical protein AB7J32_24375 [Pseudonocardia sp.]